MITSKKDKVRLILISIAIIGLTSGLVAGVYSDCIEILDNRASISMLESTVSDLELQEESLDSELNKLKDPDYIARYAKEKYLYTEEGELIIKFD